MEQRRKSCQIKNNVAVAHATQHNASVSVVADNHCPVCECDPCDCGWGSYTSFEERRSNRIQVPNHRPNLFRCNISLQPSSYVPHLCTRYRERKDNLDKKPEHNTTKRTLIFKIGDLVYFKSSVTDVSVEDRSKIWIIKDYVNKAPEEHSCYDYILTDTTEDVVAIEFELKEVKDEGC